MKRVYLSSANCGSPPAISDATVATPGGTLEGSTETYICDSGFGLASGDATLTCVSGICTGTPPTCSGTCIIRVSSSSCSYIVDVSVCVDYVLGESLGARTSPRKVSVP